MRFKEPTAPTETGAPATPDGPATPGPSLGAGVQVLSVIIKRDEDGEDRIYMIRETKSTLDDAKLRPTELAKIKSAKKRFTAIGIESYERSTPGHWNL